MLNFQIQAFSRVKKSENKDVKKSYELLDNTTQYFSIF